MAVHKVLYGVALNMHAQLLMVSCSGFGLPMHAQLLRLFVTTTCMPRDLHGSHAYLFRRTRLPTNRSHNMQPKR